MKRIVAVVCVVLAGLALWACELAPDCGCKQDPLEEYGLVLHENQCPQFSEEDWREYDKRTQSLDSDGDDTPSPEGTPSQFPPDMAGN